VTDTLEHTARQIAERGRDELVARLRPAFEDAAKAHADVLEISPEQLEQMVQRAADRADGLQWRRALASVASEQLSISMGEALSHPAVARAQAIVGAPSYEESLEKLKTAARTAPQPVEAEAAAEEGAGAAEEGAEGAEAAEAGEAEEVEEPEAGEAEAVEEDAQEEPAAEPQPTVEAEAVDSGEGEEDEGEEDEAEEDGTLHIAAVHLGGIANLSPAESGIELRLSEAGLDIARAGTEVLGRLAWADISELQVPQPRGVRRRRRSETHLVVRTAHGDASFQIPGLTADELREHLDPMIKRYKR
jgi:hypothetical protein